VLLNQLLATINRYFNSHARHDRARYGVAFHALLTRQAGARRFTSFHLLVPRAITLTHIEPISQPASYEDIELERWSEVSRRGFRARG
jgi:divalent metal cation (Fe/Co/Zn/Cd) transporter